MRFLALVILFNASLFAQEGVWYKDIDHALANPDSVFQLQLKRKGLNAFPSGLSQFPNLQKLDLSKNKIGVFPDSLNHLKNLTFLDLSRNNISVIPDAISELILLEHLDLWHNDVDALSNQILELPYLNYLDIRGVSMSNGDYEKYKEMMKGINFFMSAPCDCQD